MTKCFIIYVFTTVVPFISIGADYGLASSAVSQSAYTGTVIAGDKDVIVGRVSVTGSGMGKGAPGNPVVITSISLSTAGTPETINPADLAMSRLWYTRAVSNNTTIPFEYSIPGLVPDALMRRIQINGLIHPGLLVCNGLRRFQNNYKAIGNG